MNPDCTCHPVVDADGVIRHQATCDAEWLSVAVTDLDRAEIDQLCLDDAAYDQMVDLAAECRDDFSEADVRDTDGFAPPW